MSKFILFLFTLLVMAASCEDPNAPMVLGPEFGFGKRLGGAYGERPTIIGLLHNDQTEITWGNATDASGLPNPQYYYDLFFGEGRLDERSAANYFQSISYDNFTITPAAGIGVFGPYQYSSSSIPDAGQFLIKRLGEEGLDFSQFDTNADGIISNSELLVMVIDNQSARGGAVRTGDCVYPENSQGVAVCTNTGAAGSKASFSTYVHELSHILGTYDLYGSNCHNTFLSLMSCTIYPYDHWLPIWDLDPWHKMVLGWIRPRVFDIPLIGLNSTKSKMIATNDDNAQEFERDEFLWPGVISKDRPLFEINGSTASRVGECATLEVTQSTGETPSKEMEPIILYSSQLGTLNFLMLEYRSRHAAVPGRFNFDNYASGQGVAIWQIGLKNETTPLTIAGVKEDSNDTAVFTFGAPAGVRGGKELWHSRHEEIAVKWYDGRDTGLRLRVGPIHDVYQRTVDVEWGLGGMPLAKIESVKINNNELEILGSLGTMARGRSVVLNNQGVSQVLQVKNWSCSQLRVELPADLAAGSYSVSIIDDQLQNTESSINFSL